MSVIFTLTQWINRLWHGADLARVGQRRERRVQIVVSALMVLVGMYWASSFFGHEYWQMLAFDGAMIACGLAVLGQRVLWVNVLLFGSLIALVALASLFMDANTPAAMRSTHLFLLPIAVGALLAFRDQIWLLRYGVCALCLSLFIALTVSNWQPSYQYLLSDELRLPSAWLQALLAMGLLFVLLHTLQKDSAEHMELDRDLHEALREGQFILHYQPQVDEAGRVVGAEALIRWQHPKRGLLPPSEFIDYAEETGLIIPIGQWVLEQIAEQLRLWRDEPLYQHLDLAVNISQKQFAQRHFVAQILSLIERHEIDAKHLELELTETLIVRDLDDLTRKMVELVGQGVSFSLDDFGTGFSSLSHLKRLPLSKLKIDRSFISDVLTDSHSEAIVRSVINLGQNLGLQVIAEGVEVDDQRQFLRDNGCRRYQGYLLGRPMPLEHFCEFVQCHNA